jgi:hypothetical protein
LKTRIQGSTILWYEAFGFLTIIALSWVNELSDLPYLVGGTNYVPNWRESALETGIVAAIGIVVMIHTRRLLSRLHYLERFVRVCAWCKKLKLNGEWVPLEQFFETRFQTETSHGMCDVCVDEVKGQLKQIRAA